MPEVEAVAEDLRVTENAFELYIYVTSLIFFGDGEMVPVPSNVVLRIAPPYLLIAMGVARLGRKGEVNDPVVRERDPLPGGVVERRVGRTLVLSDSLGKIGEVFRAVLEIALHGRRIAKGERPIVINEMGLSLRQSGRQAGRKSQNGVKCCPHFSAL